jgi:predicted metal-dependent peptidase
MQKQKILIRPRKCKVSNDVHDALVETRTGLLLQRPFWASLLMDIMKVEFTRDVPTAATDGLKLWINPEFFMQLKLPIRMFVLAHEIAHAMFRHLSRASYFKDMGFKGNPFCMPLWNIACDYVINDLLKEDGFHLWDKCLHDRNIAQHDDWVDDIYDKLYEQQQQQGGGDDGDESESGSGGAAGGGSSQSQQQDSSQEEQAGGGGSGDGDGDDDTDGHDPAGFGDDPDDYDEYGHGKPHDTHIAADETAGKNDEAQWRRAVSSAAQVARQQAKQKDKGNLPAHLQRWVDAILEPQVEWRDKLRFGISNRVGYDERTWSRPRRRDLTLRRLYLPGSRGCGAGHIVIAIDTSGSISDRELTVFFTEIQSILSDARPETVWIVPCDAQVHEPFEINPDTPVGEVTDKIHGGGGTAFEPVFEWIEEKYRMRPDCVVYLTDMYGSFGTDPGYPVIWCATTDVEGPYGETLKVDLNA